MSETQTGGFDLRALFMRAADEANLDVLEPESVAITVTDSGSGVVRVASNVPIVGT